MPADWSAVEILLIIEGGFGGVKEAEWVSKQKTCRLDIAVPHIT